LICLHDKAGLDLEINTFDAANPHRAGVEYYNRRQDAAPEQ
jgi:hypothetical protein